MKKNVSSKRTSVPKTPPAETDGGEKGIATAITLAPLPRPPRRRQKPKLDRGLPEDAELARLAEAYLERQLRNYPDAANGAIPAASPSIIGAMIDDFKHRHRGGAVDVEQVKVQLKAIGSSKAGGAYTRFSCDNSNPTSIMDQLLNCLDKSQSEAHFIPWAYIYADFAVTGLDASRQGYSSYKKVLADKRHIIETTYIDDFTRASRDEKEWWNLAALSSERGKRLIGAADGFDLSSPQADVTRTVCGLMSRLNTKSLQEKVGRGMKGAADRGTILGKLPLGFARRQKLDGAGNPMFHGDGSPLNERCIDSKTAAIRLQMYELYVRENWSATKITKHFNKHRLEDWGRWTTRTVTDLIWSATAIGVFIWNRTRRKFDHDDKRWKLVKRPRSEWKVFFSRELAIVPLDLWRAARRKLAQEHRRSPHTCRPKSRNEKNPSTLFSGTLFCDCCGKELKLQRSTGAAKQLGTVDGTVGIDGCRLPGSRSTRVIEDCLLGYLRDQLLTPEIISMLVTKANAILDEEAQKPIPQAANLKKQIAEWQRMINRLVRRSAKTEDDSVAAKFESEIKRLTQEIEIAQASVSAAQAAKRRKVDRLDPDMALELLSDLHSVLEEDCAVAGLAIRELTGPIRIRREPINGSKGRSRWIASLTPQVAVLLKKVCPTECGHFAAASIPDANTVEIVLDKTPVYQQLAAEFQRLQKAGVGALEIAAKCGVGHHTLMDGLYYAETGQPRCSRPKSQRNRTRYKEIAPEVVRLIDEGDMQIKDIASQMGVSESVIRRAYDHLCGAAALSKPTCRSMPPKDAGRISAA